jgi:cell division protein FtsI (penicillin-binding protein 3)
LNALTYSAAVAAGRVRLANVRERSLLVARVRLLIVLACFAVAAAACLARITYLGVADPADSGASGGSAAQARGEIVDRNGVPLARAFPAYALWYNPEALGTNSPLVSSPAEVAHALARIFPDTDEADLLRRLKAKRPGYLRRRLLPEEANKVHALGEPALEFPRENDRYYPQGSLAAHVLGYVDTEGHGQVGMEQVLDSQLKSPAALKTPRTLSIDVRAQGALEEELGRGMRETNAIGAAGVVLDVDSGEILALASLPAFDPNRVDKAINSLVFNKVTNQVYELGSTFKPLAIASAIDAGVVTNIGENFPAAPLHIGGFTIRDSHSMGATVNVAQTLVSSSNVGTAQIADRLGSVRMKQYMGALGFSERPVIELPARGFPLWRKGEWPRLTTMTVS